MDSGKVAEDDAQRLIGSDLVVAIGCDEEAAGGADASAEVAQQVEGRFVGPVDVFDNEQRGARRGLGELGEDGTEDAVALDGGGVKEVVEAEVGRDVEERTECARGHQRVARADGDAGLPLRQLGQVVDQGGLADTCLAAEEHHAATPGSRRRRATW